MTPKEKDKMIEEARIEAGGIDWDKFPNFKKAIEKALQSQKSKLREDIEKIFKIKGKNIDRSFGARSMKNNIVPKVLYEVKQELLKSLEDK